MVAACRRPDVTQHRQTTTNDGLVVPKMAHEKRSFAARRGTVGQPRSSCFSSQSTTRKPCCLSITAGYPGDRLLGCTTKKGQIYVRHNSWHIHGNATPHGCFRIARAATQHIISMSMCLDIYFSRIHKWGAKRTQVVFFIKAPRQRYIHSLVFVTIRHPRSYPCYVYFPGSVGVIRYSHQYT